MPEKVIWSVSCSIRRGCPSVDQYQAVRIRRNPEGRIVSATVRVRAGKQVLRAGAGSPRRLFDDYQEMQDHLRNLLDRMITACKRELKLLQSRREEGVPVYVVPADRPLQGPVEV